MVKLVKRKYTTYFSKCTFCDSLVELNPEDVTNADICNDTDGPRDSMNHEYCAVNGQCPKCGYFYRIDPNTGIKYFYVELFGTVGEVRLKDG